MTTTDVKKFVKRHRMVIFGGTMLVAGIIIGRRMDISYSKLVRNASETFDTVVFEKSKKEGSAMDIVMYKKSKTRRNGIVDATTLSLELNDAKEIIQEITDIVKEVESVQA